MRAVTVNADRVYLLPGRGNRLDDHIGASLSALGYDVYGREVLPPFSSLGFDEQVAVIRRDLLSRFWEAQGRLFGHSYGGYLLLHALAGLAPFSGRVLLFSPVLGAAIDRTRMFLSRPPYADRLLRLAESGKLPVPAYLEIHTGAEDAGCDPLLAQRIAAHIPGARLTIAPHQEHSLDPGYVAEVIARFMAAG